jgi:hypothetical protein
MCNPDVIYKLFFSYFYNLNYQLFYFIINKAISIIISKKQKGKYA